MRRACSALLLIAFVACTSRDPSELSHESSALPRFSQEDSCSEVPDTSCTPHLRCFSPRAFKHVSAPDPVCDAEQIDAFYALCMDRGGLPGRCAARFESPSDATCARCLRTSREAVQLGPAVEIARTLIVNVAGCLEREGETACAMATQDAIDCGFAACEPHCRERDAIGTAKLHDCRYGAATLGPCRRFEDVAAACRASIPPSSPAGRCPLTDMPDRDAFAALAMALCGASGGEQ